MHLWSQKKIEREEMREKTFEEMIADNFPSLRKTVNLQIQESQQIPE